jgi:tRNA G18 (ribose-2'-O)-methylase SpoU
MDESALRACFSDLRFAGARLHPEHGLCFVAEGRILGEDALAWGRAGRLKVVAVLAEEKEAAAVAPLLPEGAALLTAGRAEMEALVGFPFHRGFLTLAQAPAEPPDEQLLACRRLLVLPALADAENLGQLIRTAAALGMDGALLGPGPDPFSRRVVRVSMGTCWKLPLWRREDPWAALEAWKGGDGEVAAAALRPDGLDARDWVPAPRSALVLGPEGAGLSPEDLARCGRAVRIPMAPGVDSLNVAAAGAILMHRMLNP